MNGDLKKKKSEKMTEIILKKYSGEKDAWNKFVQESNNGTIFHNIDFLEYHGDKFKDNEHHIVWYKGSTIIALMPMAIFHGDEYDIATSPYGASYGGIIFKSSLTIKDAEEIVSTLSSYLDSISVKELTVTITPSIYLIKNSNYIDFFLLKCGAKCINSDLTCYINIVDDMIGYFNKSGRKAVNKALKTKHLVVFRTKLSCHIKEFYKILVKNRKKFNATPVHSIRNIEYLIEKFPEDIVLFMAYLGDTAIAGSLVFKCNEKVVLDFYWAHLDEYQEYRGISRLVYAISLWANDNGIEYFDFGTQTQNMEISYGGSRFKETFNATGVFRKTYKWVIE